MVSATNRFEQTARWSFLAVLKSFLTSFSELIFLIAFPTDALFDMFDNNGWPNMTCLLLFSRRKYLQVASLQLSSSDSNPQFRLAASSRRAAYLVDQRPVRQRLGEVDATDVFRAVEVGERARDAQHAVIAARGEPHRLGGVAQQFQPGGVRLGDLLEHGALRLRVGAHARKPERGVAFYLHLARGGDARGDLAAALGGRRQDQVGGAHGRDFDV